MKICDISYLIHPEQIDTFYYYFNRKRYLSLDGEFGRGYKATQILEHKSESSHSIEEMFVSRQ